MPELHPYQKEGSEWLAKKTFAMLFDVPGLGKTAQALRALKPGLAVIICPAHLKRNWAEEIDKWMLPTDEVNYVVWSVDNLAKLPRCSRPQVIIDESHYLKNPTTKRWASYVSWRNEVNPRSQWLLTGTPHPNGLIDLWGQFALSNHPEVMEMLGTSSKSFQHRHGIWERGPFGASCTALKPSGSNLLFNIAKVVGKGRNFNQVGMKLPPLLWHRIPVRNNRAEFLRAVEERCKAKSMSIHNPNSWLAASLCESATRKIDVTLKIISDLPQDESLLVFGKHLEPLRELRKGMKGTTAEITSDTPQGYRNKIVEMWKLEKVRTIFTTHAVMGTGLNMTEGRHAVIFEPDWSMDNIRQSIGRLHRMGQECPVNVWVPFLMDSSDETYARNIRRKEGDRKAFKGALKKRIDKEIRELKKKEKQK